MHSSRAAFSSLHTQQGCYSGRVRQLCFFGFLEGEVVEYRRRNSWAEGRMHGTFTVGAEEVVEEDAIVEVGEGPVARSR